ncbi:MAG: transcription antitermination protein NusB [Candidatus Gracilibacteria bacterium]|jgi:N utilization substance protein B
MSFSRSRTRRFVLQSLYARSIAGAVISKKAPFFEDADRLDDAYAALLVKNILENEGKILSVIYEYAPKFDIKTLPLINAIILYISLTETLLLCPEDVPPRVSINEAIELAKRYSDDPSKNLINGILNTVLEKTKAIQDTWKTREPLQYSIFSV